MESIRNAIANALGLLHILRDCQIDAGDEQSNAEIRDSLDHTGRELDDALESLDAHRNHLN